MLDCCCHGIHDLHLGLHHLLVLLLEPEHLLEECVRLLHYGDVLLVALSWGKRCEGNFMPRKVISRKGHCPVSVQGVQGSAKLEEDSFIRAELVGEPTTGDGFLILLPFNLVELRSFELNPLFLGLLSILFDLFLSSKGSSILLRLLVALLFLQESEVGNCYLKAITWGFVAKALSP